MKNLSIRWKITLAFSAAILLMTLLTMLSELVINETVIQKGIRDMLVETVEDNVDEVEFYEEVDEEELEEGKDIYLEYRGGLLEIDDDYLDVVNGIYTSLYTQEGEFLYGETIFDSKTEDREFVDGSIKTVKIKKERYYIYDRQLVGEGLDGLWLRGMVSMRQGTDRILFAIRVSFFLLPLFGLLSVASGYFIAGKSMQPIKQIQSTVDRIRESEDLTQRIHIGPGEDELHRLANTFDAMFDRIEGVFKLQKKFASDASHELRTPVTVILSQCEYSLEQPQTEEEYIEALRLIARQGKKMSVLVNELLAFTRLEERKESMVMERLDFSTLVEEICKDMALIQEKDITLEYEVEPSVFVKGNGELLTKLLNNLIINAYRYGVQGGHIFVTLTTTAEEIRLSVADDGIGISEEDLEQIWNRFYQADASRGSRGAGLGLPMVEEIAKLHKGRMTVESKIGEGSCFVLHLRK
jgi:hypothetical protein